MNELVARFDFTNIRILKSEHRITYIKISELKSDTLVFLLQNLWNSAFHNNILIFVQVGATLGRPPRCVY